ncbi:arylesterase [Candidatus Nomurabacteria bacterium]|nr:arylesterase [Candidatus Kaiserbacteria bacterium]MCB9814063.1 arylesterase [Candidatus Nomurabacteria bacterium]
MNKWILIIGIIVCAGLGWWFWAGDSYDEVSSSVEPKEESDSLIKIIAFGDSLTAGYGLSRNEAYPAQLEAALKGKGYSVSVINAGVSGETTRGNLERASFIAAQNPDIVLLGIGGNDALRTLPIAETKKNILETVSVLEGSEFPPTIILLEMQAPLNAGVSYKQDFDAIYAEVATEKNLLLVPFITKDLFLNPENKLPDGVHYNQIGYSQVVEKYILPATEEALKKLVERGG